MVAENDKGGLHPGCVTGFFLHAPFIASANILISILQSSLKGLLKGFRSLEREAAASLKKDERKAPTKKVRH